LKKLINYIFSTLEVQLAVFPEFISFLDKKKEIIRIVVDSNNPIDSKLFDEFGIYNTLNKLYTSKSKNSFGLISEFKTESCSIPIQMLTLSFSNYNLDKFVKAEISGDTEKSGILLGYPKCCCNNIEEINFFKNKWAIYYLEDFSKNGIASKFANRFPIAIGGMSLIGELFPCSLSCKAAISYTQMMIESLEKYSFNEIIKTSLIYSALPVHINRSNGEISKESHSDFETIIFS
jgi:hypothetical protein